MASPLLLLLLLGCLCLADANVGVWNLNFMMEKLYRGNLQGLQAILAHPQMPERYLTGKESFHKDLKTEGRVLQFSWSNCGAATDPVKIKSLDVQPDPIKLPGELVVSFDVQIDTNVTSPFAADLTIQKKVAFWWVDVPCVDQFGSCSYADMCVILPGNCPAPFQQYHVPCNCPFNQGEYVMTQGDITVPELPLPSWLSSGDYKIDVTGKAADGSRLFCIHLEASLG